MRAFYIRGSVTAWKSPGLVFCLLASLTFISNGCKKDDNNEGGGTAAKPVDTQLIADNLVSPLGLEQAPDQSKRLFIFDQTGKIFIVDSGGNLLTTPFLDISNKLVALSPGY